MRHTQELSAARLFAAAIVLVSSLSATSQSANGLVWLKGGHASKIEAVAYATNGAVFASASDDATVKLWSTNGNLLKTLTTHPYQATAVAFSPDGTKLAVGTYAGGYLAGYSNGLGRVLVWQATNGWAATNVTLLRALTNKFGKVTSVAFSSDGARLASGTSGGSNYVHQVSDGTLLASRMSYATNRWVSGETNAPVACVAFSPAGSLATACDDGAIRVWNSSYTPVWSNNTAHASNATAVAFSPNGGLLASGALDQTIRIWSTTNWACLRVLAVHTNGVTALAFSPDGNTLASGGSDGTLKLWDAAGAACRLTIAAHAGALTSLAFSPDGKRLLSGGADNTVQLWSVADGSPVLSLGNHADYVKAVAISPDGTLCASASNDESIKVRRLLDGLLLQVLPGNTGCISALAFAPDSSTLASGGGPLDPAIKLWRLSDGTVLNSIAATSNGVMALAFSPGGSTLASGGDSVEQIICLWRASDGSLLQTLPGHTNGVTALAFSPAGDLLASGGRRFDNAVKVWAITNGTLLRAFTGHSNNVESLAFAEDGDQLASGSSGTNNLFLWRVSDGSVRSVGTDTNAVWFVGFTPDGGTLASAAKDAIKFWNVSSGALSQTLTQETFRVCCAAYSPNGNFLLYGREDATLALCANQLGALGQPPLSFNRITAAAGAGIELAAAVQPKTHYLFEASSNLADWTWLSSGVSRSNSLQIRDNLTNGAPARFYRAITPP